MSKKQIVKTTIAVLVAAVIAVALEIVVFDWQSVETFSLKGEQPVSQTVYDSNGYHCIEYVFDDADIKDIDLTSDLPDSFESESMCAVFAIDEGSSVYYKLGDVWMGSSSTHLLHPTGKVKKIAVVACPVTPKVSLEAGSSSTYSLAGATGQSSSNPDSEADQDSVGSSGATTSSGLEMLTAPPAKTDSGTVGTKVNVDGSVTALEQLPIGFPSNYSDADLQNSYFAIAYDNILQPGEFYVDYSAQFNTPIPLDISKRRLLVVFVGLLLLYAFRPKSLLYSRNYRSGAFFAFLCCASTACVLAIVATHLGYLHSDEINYRQYIELAKAFANGQLYIGIEPNSALMAMDNPYDTNARAAAKVEYLWDYAYYNGHYYVYFGVLPALLYQLPFLLITGHDLPVAVDTVISAIAFCCGAVYLMKKICDRWFPKMTQGLFALLLLVLLLGSWASYACAVPGHYGVPIITGLACLVWGLAFWISATAGGTIRVGRAVVGSLFVALIIACRPQLLAGGLIGVVLLAGCFRHMEKPVFARRVAFALVPFIVVFALVCWYNAARFGNPFNFGANYNLTTNDMTHRSFSLDRLPFALFVYLFQLPVLKLEYPYIATTDLASGYYGINITEDMWGGIFMLTPVLLVSVLLLLKQFRKRFRPAPLALALASLLIGFVLVVFDANGAGVLMRYSMDFGFFFALAAVMCITQLWPAEGNNTLVVVEDGRQRYTAVAMLLLILVAASYLFQACWLLVNAG
jgi:hypothetical protein